MSGHYLASQTGFPLEHVNATMRQVLRLSPKMRIKLAQHRLNELLPVSIRESTACRAWTEVLMQVTRFLCGELGVVVEVAIRDGRPHPGILAEFRLIPPGRLQVEELFACGGIAGHPH